MRTIDGAALDDGVDEPDDDSCGGCGDWDCPACFPCEGDYQPGTEECDFCEHSDECAMLTRKEMRET